MPLNKNAYLRYRIIDRCLTNSMRPFPDKAYIVEKIEEMLGPVSVSSVEKDLGKMKELFGAPIVYNRDKKGYAYAEKDFSIREFPLTGEEITALDFSTAVLQILKSSPFFKKAEGAIDKVINGYRVGKLLQKEETELLQMEMPLGEGGGEWIEPVYAAIVEQQCLQLLYQPFDREPKEHIIAPYLLKEYRNRWYVIGHSDKAGKAIVFALDRIRSLQPAAVPWVSAGSFDAKQYFRYSFGITHLYNNKPQRVVLSFLPEQAPYILTQPLHPSQKTIKQNAKELRIEITVFLTHELLMCILGYGTAVKVLAPKSLSLQVKSEAKAIYSQYG